MMFVIVNVLRDGQDSIFKITKDLSTHSLQQALAKSEHITLRSAGIPTKYAYGAIKMHSEGETPPVPSLSLLYYSSEILCSSRAMQA